jgi:hypothetical protein
MVDKEKVLRELEKTYQQLKDQECEELHNKFVDVLNQLKPALQNALFVCDLVKFELLSEKFNVILKIKEEQKK